MTNYNVILIQGKKNEMREKSLEQIFIGKREREGNENQNT